MPSGLAEEQLQRVGRRLDRRGELDDRLGVGRLLDDVDRAPVELA